MLRDWTHASSLLDWCQRITWPRHVTGVAWRHPIYTRATLDRGFLQSTSSARGYSRGTSFSSAFSVARVFFKKLFNVLKLTSACARTHTQHIFLLYYNYNPCLATTWLEGLENFSFFNISSWCVAMETACPTVRHRKISFIFIEFWCWHTGATFG